MQTATMTLSFGPTATPRPWQQCDWIYGDKRKFGKQAHVKYSDGSYIGSATRGPTDWDACLSVNEQAKRWRDAQERALIDFVIKRFRYYREEHTSFSVFACKVAVARDADLSVDKVSAVLTDTYALVA